MYGTYVVQYTAVDFFGNSKPLSFIYSVMDTKAPNAELVTGYQTSAKINKTIALASVLVSDNYSGSDEITILTFISDPQNNLTMLTGAENSFYFNQKGVYTISYYVKDFYGNVNIVSYNITVEA
jgi:hypothetical protein